MVRIVLHCYVSVVQLLTRHCQKTFVGNPSYFYFSPKIVTQTLSVKSQNVPVKVRFLDAGINLICSALMLL